MADPTAEYGPPLRLGTIRWPRPGAPGSFGFARTASHHHQGVDLQAPAGTPWLAAADGVIRHVVTGPDRNAGFAGYGKVVVLEHQDRGTDRPVYILYAHGQDVTVSEGQRVQKGHELGKVGSSQYAANPTREEGSMGAHLHLETSTRDYPQGPEARTRMDPTTLFGVRIPPRRTTPPAGTPPPSSPREPSADRAPAPTPAPAPEDIEPGEVLAKQALRQALMNRLALTDVRVALLQAQLRTQGHTTVAAALGAAWAEPRARLWALLVRPSRLAEIRAVVGEWLAKIEELAAQARALVPAAMHAFVERVRRELRGIWERGINWAEENMERLRVQVLGAAAVGAGALIIFAVLWGMSKAKKKR